MSDEHITHEERHHVIESPGQPEANWQTRQT
jgi:hypothetical protein